MFDMLRLNLPDRSAATSARWVFMKYVKYIYFSQQRDDHFNS